MLHGVARAVGRRIDLRSDTVTLPSASMREAMARAELGDDVLGEDPTTNELERYAADLLGKERALFMPSGTAANLCAALAWCDQRGGELLCGRDMHIACYEGRGVSVLGGIALSTIDEAPDGTLPLAAVREALRGRAQADVHTPDLRLVVCENTHNRRGGVVLPDGYCADLAAIVRPAGVRLHLDGARLANAGVATGKTLARLAHAYDSVALCLSKGLGAPAGSVLAGPADFVARARRWRKVCGGGMRQTGVLAAAGRLALGEASIAALAADHKRCAYFRRLLAGGGLDCMPSQRATNMAFVTVRPGGAEPLAAALAARGVLCYAMDSHRLRFVFHNGIADDDVAAAAHEVLSVVAERSL